MKKILFSFIALTFLATACQNESVNDVISEELTSSVDNDLSIIKSLGFDTTSIEDNGDHYTVEGDIMLYKKELTNYARITNDSSQLRQAYTAGQLVSMNKIRDIKVKINGSVPQSWHQAIDQALKEWSSIPGCAIKMRKVTGSQQADITIALYRKSQNIIARASHPFNGNPGPTVMIDPSNSVADQATRTYVMIHELGHCLGLRHTDWQNKMNQNGDFTNQAEGQHAITIPGTTGTDYGSVMNSLARPWKGFSQDDITAVRTLYRAPMIMESTKFAKIGDIVEFSIERGFGVRWKAVQNAIITSGDGTTKAKFKVTGNGVVKVEVSVAYGGFQWLEENNNVWAGAPAKPVINTDDRFFYGSSQVASVKNYQTDTQYKWEIDGAKIQMESNHSVTFRILDSKNNGYVRIWVTAINNCGSSTNAIVVPVTRPGSGNNNGIDRD